MKRLLQSKYFKRHLKKWLGMYAVCMVCFTTLITYSKYMSVMFSSDDEARVSKFQLNLKYCEDAACSSPADSYQMQKFRPFEPIVYYFSVDSSKLEVDSVITYTFRFDSSFTLDSVKRIHGENKTDLTKSGEFSYEDDNIAARSDESIIYEVTLHYDQAKASCTADPKNCVKNDGEFTAPKYLFEEGKIFDTLRVDYSASQKQ